MPDGLSSEERHVYLKRILFLRILTRRLTDNKFNFEKNELLRLSAEEIKLATELVKEAGLKASHGSEPDPSDPFFIDPSLPEVVRMPDFVIPGMMKCGTGALGHFLGAHPLLKQNVFGQEVDFYTHEYEKGEGSTLKCLLPAYA